MSNTNNNSNTMEMKDTVSSCSVSNDQEMQQLHKKALFSKASCMNGLKALQSNFKILLDDLKHFGGVATFKRIFSQDMDLLEKHLTKEILHEIDYKTALTKLKTMFENTLNSELRDRRQKYTSLEPQFVKDTMIDDIDFIEKYMIDTILHQQEIQQLLNEKKLQTQEVQINTVKALNVDLIIMENTCSGKENSNSQTAFNKSVKESSLDSKTKDVLSKEDLKGTRIEHGSKRAFMSLFGQDDETFTSTMFLNVDQLQKQLDKYEFQEDGSMAAFWVINKQFQKFIDSQFTLNYDSQRTDKYFAEYPRIEVK
ncbi:hypothetical protein Tco_0434454 [Tanacetum coccineum]